MTEGSFIKKARVSAKYSQKALARRMGFGSPQFISNVERDIAGLPLKHVKRFLALTKADGAKLKRIKLRAFEQEMNAWF